MGNLSRHLIEIKSKKIYFLILFFLGCFLIYPPTMGISESQISKQVESTYKIHKIEDSIIYISTIDSLLNVIKITDSITTCNQKKLKKQQETLKFLIKNKQL